MNYQLIHHGGATGVTGSCHELQLDGLCLLIDCGQCQGLDTRQQAVDLVPVARRVQGVVITHAHLDHIGRLTELLHAGFSGPIYCSDATAALLPLVLEDNWRQSRSGSDAQLYAMLRHLAACMRPQPYGQWLPLPACHALRLQCAGHILGSAYIEIRNPAGEVIVFSGDIGPANGALLALPRSPERADVLVLESTYGDRQHAAMSRRDQLRQVVEHSLADGGAVLIPAFSIGRTQEVLSDLAEIICEVTGTSMANCWRGLPVVLDSPLATKVTKLYRRFSVLWRNEARQRWQGQRHPLDFSQMVTVTDAATHYALVQRLAKTGERVIVVAGSGMCQGGRIVDYLQALLPDPRTDVLLAGFQAQGTVGRQLQEGKAPCWPGSDPVPVWAQIHSLSGYSAHADQRGLLDFVQGMRAQPKTVHLVHGEQSARLALAAALQAQWPGIGVRHEIREARF